MKKIILKIVISIIILVIIFNSIDLELFKKTKLYFSVELAFGISVLLIISLLLRTYRWHLLMNQKKPYISFSDSIKLFLIGQSLNILLPSGAGDVAKSYYGYKWTGVKERMLSISLIDKLIAIASLFFISVFVFFKSRDVYILFAGILSITPLLIFINIKNLKKLHLFNTLILRLNNRTKILNINDLLSHFEFSLTSLIIPFSLSILAWVATYSLLYLCFGVLNSQIDFYSIINSIPYLTLGRLFPFTLNGIGSDEALILYLFSEKNISNEIILVAAVLYRIILMFIPAIFGLPYLINKRNEKSNF